jgi:hypothetical protein
MTRRARTMSGVTALSFGLIAFLGARSAGVFGARDAAATSAIDPDSGLIAHEWGTFTSVAGADGQPVAWQPLGDTLSDLPCFVRILNETSIKNWVPALQATVRMETPVVYFYSATPRTVDVHVRVPHGIITEWYPNAEVPPFVMPSNMDVAHSNGVVSWHGVRVMPGDAERFSTEDDPSHYYAARATDAAPIRVGVQREKFLFYRGLASFPIPVTATISDNGSVRVSNTAAAPIPAVILFEKKRGQIGYRVVRDLRGATTLAAPSLDGTFESLRGELERMLVAEGLYAREAKAMVETWRDSWFENGTRVFYLMPQARIDSVLPMRITPAPTRTVRVFVGRVELITPAMIDDAVAKAKAHDREGLRAYGRIAGEVGVRTGDRLTRAQREAAFSRNVPVATDTRCTGWVGRLLDRPVRRY